MIKVELGSPNRGRDQEGAMGSAPASLQDPAIACKRYVRLLRMVCAEIVGTFLMMFSISAVMATGKITRGATAAGIPEYAATGGLVIVVVVFSIGHISGAHVNPAVTIAFAVTGQFPWAQVPFYVCAQFASAVLATFVAKEVYGVEGELATTRPSSTPGQAFCVELIATFFVMFLASAMVADARAIGQLSGIAVGASIALAVLLTGPVSGGSMNPARSFGPAVVANKYEHIWVYLLAPTVGAVGGAVVYRLVRLRPPLSQHPHSAEVTGSESRSSDLDSA